MDRGIAHGRPLSYGERPTLTLKKTHIKNPPEGMTFDVHVCGSLFAVAKLLKDAGFDDYRRGHASFLNNSGDLYEGVWIIKCATEQDSNMLKRHASLNCVKTITPTVPPWA